MFWKYNGPPFIVYLLKLIKLSDRKLLKKKTEGKEGESKGQVVYIKL